MSLAFRLQLCLLSAGRASPLAAAPTVATSRVRGNSVAISPPPLLYRSIDSLRLITAPFPTEPPLLWIISRTGALFFPQESAAFSIHPPLSTEPPAGFQLPPATSDAFNGNEQHLLPLPPPPPAAEPACGRSPPGAGGGGGQRRRSGGGRRG